MTIAERLLELKHSGQPFVVHLNDGRALRIRTGDRPFRSFAVEADSDLGYSIPAAEHAFLARPVIVIEGDSGYVDIVPYSAIRRLRVLQELE